MKITSLVKIGVLSSLLAVGFSGCVSGIGPKPEELVAKKYSLYKTEEKIVLSKPKAKMNYENKTVTLSNGDTILDENGDIIFVTTLNDKIYYLARNYDNNVVKLKDVDGKIVKDFGVTYREKYFKANNKIYVATTTRTDSKIYSNVYSKMYAFDGKKTRLVGKNLPISGVVVGGINFRVKYSSTDRSISGYYFLDALKNKVLDVKPSLVPVGGYSFLGSKSGYSYDRVAGIVGDTIVYLYTYKYAEGEDTKRKLILEAQNMNTGKVAILTDNASEKFVFLTNDEDVVFKASNRVIDLKTLKNASIDNNFEKIALKSSYTNLGGGQTSTSYDEYTVKNLDRATKGRGSLLFARQ